MNEELTKRQKKILRFLVKSHVEQASPVASAQLADKKGIDCSAATVRNELTTLEELGYIRQPHTSAGRVPTDRGYRFYVDNLVKREQLSSLQREELLGRMDHARGDVRQILAEASRILGLISQELGVVLTPYLSDSRFDRLELLALTDRKVLVVLHVRSRLVKTVVLEVESALSQQELNHTSSLLNERLSGLSLREIQGSIADRVKDIMGSRWDLMRLIIDSAGALFDFTEPLDIHTSGTRNIVSHPEFQQGGPLQDIFALIDDRHHLMQLFHRTQPQTDVVIGRENGDERLAHFAVVTSAYRQGPDTGRLGVIGPKRMPYGRIIPLVETMAQTVSRYLS